MDTQGIKELLQAYFDASYKANAGEMATVFHEAARIYGYFGEGKLVDMDKTAFVKRIEARAATPDSNNPDYRRVSEILSIEFLGEDVAYATVKMSVADAVYKDILSIVRLDGKWGIIAKLFAKA